MKFSKSTLNVLTLCGKIPRNASWVFFLIVDEIGDLIGKPIRLDSRTAVTHYLFPPNYTLISFFFIWWDLPNGRLISRPLIYLFCPFIPKPKKLLVCNWSFSFWWLSSLVNGTSCFFWFDYTVKASLEWSLSLSPSSVLSSLPPLLPFEILILYWMDQSFL